MRPRTLSLLAAAALALSGLLVSCVAPGAPESSVKLTKLADRVRVEVGGQLFTEYVFGDGASRSYCYPVLATDGTPLTRDFPMKKDTGEDTDHPWHRAVYYAHGLMNGVDVWDEAKGSNLEIGHAVTDAVEATSGAVGTVRTRNRYLGGDGRLLATDERTVSFHADADGRYIDWEITLHALPDKPLVMGDTKEGGMAVRVPQWMTLSHMVNTKDAAGKTVRKDTGGNGHIVTSAGIRDGKTWGTRGEWCEYHAEHTGKVYGIAIFDHPQNLRHPTWWHVRDYGLFSANPFGLHDFEKLPNEPHKGDHTIPAGGTLTLRYRFYFHLGDENAAKVAAHYADYAAGK